MLEWDEMPTIVNASYCSTGTVSAKYRHVSARANAVALFYQLDSSYECGTLMGLCRREGQTRRYIENCPNAARNDGVWWTPRCTSRSWPVPARAFEAARESMASSSSSRNPKAKAAPRPSTAPEAKAAKKPRRQGGWWMSRLRFENAQYPDSKLHHGVFGCDQPRADDSTYPTSERILREAFFVRCTPLTIENSFVLFG